MKRDSLLNALSKQAHDSTRVKTYISLAIECWKTDVPRSEKYIDSAVSLGTKINFERGIYLAWKKSGKIHYSHNDYEKAAASYSQGLNAATSRHNKFVMADFLDNIGVVYDMKGNFDKAIDFYLKSLQINEELKDTANIAESYNSLGGVYYVQGQNDKAESFFKKSIELGKKNPENLFRPLNNLANLYVRQGKYALAREEYLKTYELVKDVKEADVVATILNNIGNTYFYENNTAKMLEYNMKALALREKANDSPGLALSYLNFASHYMEMNRFDSSEKYLNKLKDISNLLRTPDARSKYLGTALRYYRKKKDFEKALVFYDAYIAVTDSMSGLENKKQISELEARYDSEKKNREIELLSKEKEIGETRLKQQKTVNSLVLGGLLITLVLSGFIFYNYSAKKKAHKIISEQKREVESAKQLIETKQKEVMDSIHYARRIQQSLMPNDNYFEKFLKKKGGT